LIRPFKLKHGLDLLNVPPFPLRLSKCRVEGLVLIQPKEQLDEVYAREAERL